MRIVGGRHGGRALASLGKGDPAAHLRPTSDRVRESVFNVIENGGYGDPIVGAKVLDLFAGTGAMGIEALSRGASEALFVENGRKAQDLIRKNIRTLALDAAVLLRRDATRLGPSLAVFDVVFLDPPYGKGLGERAIAAALSGGWIAPGALVIWEESVPPVLPAELSQTDRRRFGDTWITLARMHGA